jgi:hypothetical protein
MRRLRFGLLSSVTLTLVLALSGCGAPNGPNGQESGPQPTVAPTITLLPTATSESIYDYPITPIPGCSETPTLTQPAYVTIGGLSVSVPLRFITSSGALMPNGEPIAPYQVPVSASDSEVGAFHPNPPVNPQLAQSGYVIQVCNRSRATHTLKGIRVQVASFTARPGIITSWSLCGPQEEGPYNPAQQAYLTNCGGGGFGGSILSATFSSDGPGASAPVASKSWPVTIPAGQGVPFLIDLTGLGRQGMYTLSFAATADGASGSITSGDGSFLNAPNAIIWSGAACATPTMQGKFGANPQDAYYVCPPA